MRKIIRSHGEGSRSSSAWTSTGLRCAILASALGALPACSLAGGGSSNVFGEGPAALDVSTDEGFESSGAEGGNFFPNSKSYVLQNRGGETLDWSVTSSAPGVSFSPSTGSLDGAAMAIVTLSLDSDALSGLTAGEHAFTFNFVNLTNGEGDLSLPVEITVNASDQLAVTPGTGFPSSGPHGGPFDPLDRTYTLTNLTATNIAWSIATDSTWLTASPSAGVLAASAQTSVSLAIDPASAAQLAAGTHLAHATIHDVTNGVDTELIVTLDVLQPPTLVVWPSGGFDTSGPAGGPFDPPSKNYTLFNSGTDTLDWDASSADAWLGATPSSGTLAAGQSTVVTVSIDAVATAGMQDGQRISTVTFSNTTNDRGTTARTVTLDIFTPQAILAVGPATSLVSSGPDGGPFTPAVKNYTLTNDGNSPLAWSGSSNVPWVTLSASSGSLQPSAQASVQVRIDAALAGALAPGTHNGQVSIVNATSGVGSTTRSVQLDVFVVGSGPILVPGTGFTGPTSEPPTVGSGAGSDAKVITRWDVVPYQNVVDGLEVGVIALHRNGIDRVEFSLEGGPWLSVSQPSLNPSTGAVEYWAIVRAQDLAGGPFELRCIAYPPVGKPRLLDSLLLCSDLASPVARYASPSGNDSSGTGTLGNPFATIWRAAQSVASAQGNDAGGGIVYLQAGQYDFARGAGALPATASTYLTIRPAPGLSKTDVSIRASTSPGLSIRRLRLVDLTIRALLFGESGANNVIWLDDCHQLGPGRTGAVHSVGWFYGFDSVYLTNGSVTDNQLGPTIGKLFRDMDVQRIGEDVFRNPPLIVNCTVDDVSRGGDTSLHPDLFEIGSSAELDNHILYGVRATNIQAQGIYLDPIGGVQNLKNFAFVNVLIEQANGAGYLSQMLDMRIDHLLLWQLTLAGQSFTWRTNDLKNVSVRGCCFSSMNATAGDFLPAPTLNPAWFQSNHFTSPSSLALGTDVTTGDPRFMNPSQDDYRPGPGSPLLDRMDTTPVPVDVGGNIRSIPSSVGAWD